jgi:hypothetical protein
LISVEATAMATNVVEAMHDERTTELTSEDAVREVFFKRS